MNNSLLTTIHLQSECGIGFLKLPRDTKDLFNGRVLITKAPHSLDNQKSDWVKGVAQLHHQEQDGNNPLVDYFLSSDKVRTKLLIKEYLFRFVEDIKQCQCRDGRYCHKEKTVTKTGKGFIRTCWHHDNLAREGKIDQKVLDELAEVNNKRFMVRRIQGALGHKRDLTVADIVLFALKENLTDALGTEILAKFFNLYVEDKPSIDGSERDEVNPRDHIEKLKESVVKVRFDDDPPLQYMRSPKPQYFRSDKWLRWVKTQKCVCCGKQADDPHHLIGVGGGKMGSKADDFAVIPLCRIHHNELHRDVIAFERKYGAQKELWFDFFMKSVQLGAIEEV